MRSDAVSDVRPGASVSAIGELRFLLPASMGRRSANLASLRVQRFLSSRWPSGVEVAVSASYEAMERELLAGAAHAAWSPPLVFARVEAYGGQLLVRAIRGNLATYRAALVARRDRQIDLKQGQLRAAWVDRESLAGYTLPRVHLRELGLRHWSTFSTETFHGSYQAALTQVLEGQADVASICAGDGSAPEIRRELTGLLGARGAELEPVAVTRPCPNDGVVAAPRLGDAARNLLASIFIGAGEAPEGPGLLRELFQAQRFELAPMGTHREIYALLMAALPG